MKNYDEKKKLNKTEQQSSGDSMEDTKKTESYINSTNDSVECPESSFLDYVESHTEQILNVYDSLEQNPEILNSTMSEILSCFDFSDIIENYTESPDNIKKANLTVAKKIPIQYEKIMLDKSSIKDIARKILLKEINDSEMQINPRLFSTIEFILTIIIDIFLDKYAQQLPPLSQEMLCIFFIDLLNNYGKPILEKNIKKLLSPTN